MLKGPSFTYYRSVVIELMICKIYIPIQKHLLFLSEFSFTVIMYVQTLCLDCRYRKSSINKKTDEYYVIMDSCEHANH